MLSVPKVIAVLLALVVSRVLLVQMDFLVRRVYLVKMELQACPGQEAHQAHLVFLVKMVSPDQKVMQA